MRHSSSTRHHIPVTRTVVGIGALLALLALMSAPLVPIFDPDEGYYPATAAETLRSGTFWDLRFNDAPRWDKPLLCYAFIAAAFRVFGESVTAARVPSALEGAALTIVVGLMVAHLAGRRAGVLSAVIAGTTIGVSVFSRVAHPEIAVVLSIITTELLICVWLTTADSRTRQRVTIAAGMATGFGLLSKGPVAIALPMFMLVCVVVLLRPQRAFLMRLAGSFALSLGIAVVLALPWYLAMSVRHGAPFLEEAIWRQNIGRYTTATFGHRGNPLSVIVPAILGLFPWVAFLPQALRRVRLRELTSRELLRTAMCASAVTALAFYSLSSSKLPSYSLVCLPPLAIIIGLWLDEEFDNPVAGRRPWRQTIGLLAVVAAFFFTVPFWLEYVVRTDRLFGAIRPPTADLPSFLAGVTIPLGLLFAVAVACLVAFKTAMRRITVIACVGALTPVLGFVVARPMLQVMYPWEEFGSHVEQDHGPAWLLSRRAPSLTFYARQPVLTLPDLSTLETEMLEAPEGWVVGAQDDWTLLETSLAVRHRRCTIVATRGRMVLVRFVTATATSGAVEGRRMQHQQVAALEEMMRAVNAGDAKAYARLYADEAVITIHGSTPLEGRDAIEKYEIELLRQFPGSRLAFYSAWLSGRSAVVHYGVNGRTPAGVAMGHEGLLFFQFDASGLIEDERRYLDSFTPMAQLGVLGTGPTRALPTLPESLTVHVANGTSEEKANVAIVQATFAALDAKDRSRFLSSLAPDMALDDLTNPQPFVGRRGADTWFTTWTTAVPEARTEITAIVGIGEFVLAESIVHGTLAGTLGRVSAENKSFMIHRGAIAQLKDERLTRLSVFTNGQELARAVGQWPPRPAK
jgi:4-amino-4-deoxy-L-arabinose transferase-like glycosyltransferase/ketosteroid isomerase-like protein